MAGQRDACDRLKPMYSATFPNVHRGYDDKARAVAVISWQYCTAQEIWDIVTSKFLTSGKQETMAWFFQTATKCVHEKIYLCHSGLPGSQDATKVQALLAVNHKQWTREMFIEACAMYNSEDGVKKNLIAYNKVNKIRIVNGLFIDATAVQVDTCRLAALMIEPEMFQYLAEKSDPGQGREHADNPNLRAKELAADCMRRLTALHNDVDFVPQANADIMMQKQGK